MKTTFLNVTLLCIAAGALSAQTPTPDKIVGSWVVHVPGPEGMDFNAVHTFSADGTFTETTDLLSQLVEGPGHGVWEFKGGKYLLTFELFTFDEKTKAPAGRIRVRAEITLEGTDKIKANTVADLIEPDGHVIEAIGEGPFTGTRMKVVPVPWLKTSAAFQAVDSDRVSSAIARRVGIRKSEAGRPVR